jgi:hypothetical protein
LFKRFRHVQRRWVRWRKESSLAIRASKHNSLIWNLEETNVEVQETLCWRKIKIRWVKKKDFKIFNWFLMRLKLKNCLTLQARRESLRIKEVDLRKNYERREDYWWYAQCLQSILKCKILALPRESKLTKIISIF